MCIFSIDYPVVLIIPLPVIYNQANYTSFGSTSIPDKFIKFNEINKILKRENWNELTLVL